MKRCTLFVPSAYISRVTEEIKMFTKWNLQLQLEVVVFWLCSSGIVWNLIDPHRDIIWQIGFGLELCHYKLTKISNPVIPNNINNILK